MAYRRRPRSLSNSEPVDSREPIELIIRADDSFPYGIPAWLREQQHQVARRAKSLYIELDSAGLSNRGSLSPRQFLVGNSFKALEKLVISRAYNGDTDGLVWGYGGDDLDDADSSVGLDFDLVEAGPSFRTLIVEGIELSGGNKDPTHIEVLSLSYAAIEWGFFTSLLRGSTEFRVLKLHHSRIDDAPSRWSLTLPWLRTLSIYTTHLRDLTAFLDSIQTFNLRDLDLQVQTVSPDDLKGLSKSLASFLFSDDPNRTLSLKIGGHFAFIIQTLKTLVSSGVDHSLKELEVDSERRWPSDEIWRVHFEDVRDLVHQLELRGARISQLKCSTY